MSGVTGMAGITGMTRRTGLTGNRDDGSDLND